MSRNKHNKLESAIAAIQRQHGAQAIRPASALPAHLAIPHIPTGFPPLDELTGCQGIPLGMLTLISGQTTSGKLTLAYKTLANAQRSANAALVDLTHTTNPDYMARCGVNLERLLVVQPAVNRALVSLLRDLAQSRQVQMIVLDGLAEINDEPSVAQTLTAALEGLRHALRASGCALICIEEASPAWRRWLNRDRSAPVRQATALHISLQRERWLRHNGALAGYAARAQVMHSQWRRDSPSTTIEFTFNGVVRAQETW